MSTRHVRPINNVPPERWESIWALPATKMLAWRVTRPRFFDGFPSAVWLDFIEVQRVNRAGGYVVYQHPDDHLRNFDIGRLAPFDEMHSALPEAIRHTVSHMQAIRADREQWLATLASTALSP
jgi:hypothetical protein